MKKGFTLVELLAVIILLGLLGLIIYPTVNGVINTNKQKLHDKQIEELIRHADTYATYNMSKLRSYDGARNIVTFTDLYEDGIIQSDKVVDPSNDEELTGCMALTWNKERQAFDIEYTNNCGTSFSLNGTISGSDASLVSVKLLADQNVIYETITDESGNYGFNGILPGKYVLLVVKPLKTKYGEEVIIYENVSKNMTVELFPGDINDDDVIDAYDSALGEFCIKEIANSRFSSECINEQKGIAAINYDIDKNGSVNTTDITSLNSHASKHRISQISLSGTASVKGKFFIDNHVNPTITLHNNETTYDASAINNEFSFDNIPRGTYYLEVKKDGYLNYGKYIYLDTDFKNIKAYLYAGDVNNDGVIDQTDIDGMNSAIERNIGPSSVSFKRYDLNDDGVIDNTDLTLLQRNLGKSIFE